MTEKKSGPNIAKLVIVLTLVSAVVAAILGGVNAITKDKIAAITEQKTNDALAEVLPVNEGETYTELDYTGDSTITHVWEAPSGHVVELVVSGAQSMIDLVVGVDNDGVVTGVSIISHSETAGLGAVAAAKTAKGQAFRDQFIGQSGSPAVTKDGGNIDAIASATITSRAVTEGVSTALAWVRDNS